MLSDLYAMGVVNCHNMLMLLAVSKEMTDRERDVVIPLMMEGFQVMMMMIVDDMLLMIMMMNDAGHCPRGRLPGDGRPDSYQPVVHDRSVNDDYDHEQ